MLNEFSRTELLLGKEKMNRLSSSRVIVFGVGGVGGYACEALARSGVGTIDIVDNDKVSLTNINRQIIATHKTIDKYKVDVMKERMVDINPNIKVNIHKCFFLPENSDSFNFEEYDYIIDAVDTVAAKIAIIEKATRLKIPVISAMGAGNKLDPTGFKVSDIYKTKVCPLARVMRAECKKRNIPSFKVVYSEEQPRKPVENLPIEESKSTTRRDTPGSITFAPSVAGLIIASEVIKDLVGGYNVD
jgi:tRNA threonylcarbamoyladenosine dehydratase